MFASGKLPLCRHVISGIVLGALLGLVVAWTSEKPARSSDEPKPAANLEMHPGDHISIIGNNLAERMQHDGWLETYFHARFPKHDLSFRNLAFSGDELTL